jgi:hypothetical protein
MTVELNWHEGDEQSGFAWAPATTPLPPSAPAAPAPAAIVRGKAEAEPASRLKLLLLGMAIGIALGLLILAGVLFWRANQGSRLAQRDVAAAAALLVEAQATGDIQGYAGLLDGADQTWKARRVAGLRDPANPGPGQWTVDQVRLHGDLAETDITVTAGDDTPTRRVVFFRLNEGQWRLAPPAPSVFGEEGEAAATHFRVLYRQQDERFVPDVINLAEGAYVALCSELRCIEDSRPLDLRLLYDARADAPGLAPGEVAVASPSLAGWQPDGQPGAAFNQQLVSQIAAQLALATAPDAPPALVQVIGHWAATGLADEVAPIQETLTQALRAGSLLPLDRAWDAVARGNGDSALARAELTSMLHFLQTFWGSDAAGLLLQHSAGSFDEMARRAFDIDGESLQDGWLAWLTGQYTPSPGRTNS